jgi:glutathione synthase/RimK-type ligase-like ATP-grasp enzyme
LPNDVAKGCMDLVRRLGLRFGAIDLVLEPSGDYRFLEVNPNGQWGWIQTRTGQPIAGAIVDEMLGLWR